MRSPRAVRLHHADQELAADLLGEGDEVAARRPDRRRIAPVAEGDAPLVRAVGVHDVELLRAAAVAIRTRSGGRPANRRARCRSPALLVSWRRLRGCEVHLVDVGGALLLEAHDDALPVGREARRESHAGEIADDLRCPVSMLSR